MEMRTTGDALDYAGLWQAGDSPIRNNELFGFMDLDDFSRLCRKFIVKEKLAHFAKEVKYVSGRGIERVRRTGHVGPNFHVLSVRMQHCLWQVVLTLKLCRQDLEMKV